MNKGKVEAPAKIITKLWKELEMRWYKKKKRELN